MYFYTNSTFIHVDENIDFFSQVKEEKAIPIVSDTLVEQGLPLMYDCLKSILFMFISVHDYESLKQDVERCDEDFIRLSFVPTDGISNENLEQPSMYTKCWKKFFWNLITMNISSKILSPIVEWKIKK